MHYIIMVCTSCIFDLQMYEGKLMRKIWLDIEYMEKGERDRAKFNKCAVNIYLFKFNNKNSTKRCEICSKLKIKTNLVSSASFSYNKSKANKRYFFKIALGQSWIKTQEQRQRHRSSVFIFIVKLEYISHIFFLVFPLLTLKKYILGRYESGNIKEEVTGLRK